MTVIGRNKRAAAIEHLVYNQWTVENAWALGLITSDGGFNPSRPHEFTLSSIDLKMVTAFKDVFKSSKIPAEHKAKGRLGKNPVYRITLSSPTITGFLKTINCYGKKDVRNPFNYVPDKFKWAFIKGLFDGDGNATGGRLQIAGREELVTQVYQWLCVQIYKEPNNIYTASSSPNTKYFVFGEKDSSVLLNLFEEHANGTFDSDKFNKWKEVST